MRNSRDFTFDVLHQLKDAGLVASTANAQVGGSDRIVFLGAGRIDGRIILDITAVEVGTGDEKFEILARVSTSPTLATDVWIAGEIRVGDSTTSLETVDSVAGRRELHFTNEINGVCYPYLALKTIVAGTIATGVNYQAYLVAN